MRAMVRGRSGEFLPARSAQRHGEAHARGCSCRRSSSAATTRRHDPVRRRTMSISPAPRRLRFRTPIRPPTRHNVTDKAWRMFSIELQFQSRRRNRVLQAHFSSLVYSVIHAPGNYEFASQIRFNAVLPHRRRERKLFSNNGLERHKTWKTRRKHNEIFILCQHVKKSKKESLVLL